MLFSCHSRPMFFCEVLDFICVAPFPYPVFRKRGLKSKYNMFTFGMTLFMFALSTAYWASSIANLVAKIRSILIDPSQRSTNDIITYHLLFNAIILINVSLSKLLAAACVPILKSILSVCDYGWCCCLACLGSVSRDVSGTPHASYHIPGVDFP